MAAILTVTTAEHGTRRCDAACHYARDVKCECVCGGRFHGKGLTGELVDAVLAEGATAVADLRAQGLPVEADLGAAVHAVDPEHTHSNERAKRGRALGLFGPLDPADGATV